MLAPKAEEHKLDLILQYSSAVPRHFIGMPAESGRWLPTWSAMPSSSPPTAAC